LFLDIFDSIRRLFETCCIWEAAITSNLCQDRERESEAMAGLFCLHKAKHFLDVNQKRMKHRNDDDASGGSNKRIKMFDACTREATSEEVTYPSLRLYFLSESQPDFDFEGELKQIYSESASKKTEVTFSSILRQNVYAFYDKIGQDDFVESFKGSFSDLSSYKWLSMVSDDKRTQMNATCAEIKQKRLVCPINRSKINHWFVLSDAYMKFVCGAPCQEWEDLRSHYFGEHDRCNIDSNPVSVKDVEQCVRCIEFIGYVFEFKEDLNPITESLKELHIARKGVVTEGLDKSCLKAMFESWTIDMSQTISGGFGEGLTIKNYELEEDTDSITILLPTPEFLSFTDHEREIIRLKLIKPPISNPVPARETNADMRYRSNLVRRMLIFRQIDNGILM
jgi:hypothetical protein